MSYETLDLNLSDQGLVLIEGENKDEGGSNGSGKSSIFDAITFCAFGWTSRYGKSGREIVRRNKQKKSVGDTSVYLQWDVDGKICELHKYQDHTEHGNKLYFLIDGHDLTSGSDKDTQSIFEETVQLDLNTFKNVVLYPQKSVGFASLTDAEQKAIFDKVLGLEMYAQAQERAKVKREEFSDKRDSFKVFIDTKKSALETCKKHLEQLEIKEKEFTESKDTELVNALEKLRHYLKIKPTENVNWRTDLASVETKLEELCADQVRDIYEQAVFQQEKLSKDVNQLTGQRDVLNSQLEPYETDLPEPLVSKEQVKKDLEKWEKQKYHSEREMNSNLQRGNETRSILDNPQALFNCPTCEQPLPEDKKNKILEDLQLRLKSSIENSDLFSTKIIQAEQGITNCKDALYLWEKLEHKILQEKKSGDISKLTDKISDLRFRIDKCSQVILQSKDVVELEKVFLKQKSEIIKQVEDYGTRLILWQTTCDNLEQEVGKLESSVSPYTKLIEEQKSQEKELERSIATRAELLTYYNTQIEIASFWVSGYGNSGVKSLLLDGVTPFLNQRSNEYLQELRDNAQVVFNTQKTLASGERRDKFSISVELGSTDSYKSASGGESARIDVSVMLAMGDLLASRSLNSLDLRLLDECFSNLDALGCNQVVRLLNDIITPRSKTVFVISHEESLKSFFDKRLVVVKENGISRIENSTEFANGV